MSKIKKVGVILLVLFVALLILGFLGGSLINLLVAPSQAVYSDKVVEDIGGDNMLVATLKSCAKVGEENIADGSFKTALGQNLEWKNAKNISYVDMSGKHGFLIVWKASPEDYSTISDNNEIGYISDYLTSMEGQCFLVHYPEKDAVYGIIISTDNIDYSESDLMYDILGLNSKDFSLTYYTQSSYSSSGYSGSSSHYHTVVPDSNTLYRSDPDSYYDHYEYGDNYEADEYLESQGYD